MRILIVHPEDSPRRGPWTMQRWDLVVDLGKSSGSSEDEWRDFFRCPVLCSNRFAGGVEDIRKVRDWFSSARGRLLDDAGLDWWDLTFLDALPKAEQLFTLRRLASEISPKAELWATRSGWPTDALSFLIHRPLRNFSHSGLQRMARRVNHYQRFVQNFSFTQIEEILLDKYDSGHRWRSRFAARPSALTEASVLVPSAYENVSRMAAAYAHLLPQQSFLMVTTRQSALRFDAPPNFYPRKLAAYATRGSGDREIVTILHKWEKLKRELFQAGDFAILSKAGAFAAFPRWFRSGLSARDAWRNVLEEEPISGVLCGDDSNLFTRLPVLLAGKKGIPTVDFHHGAFDGYYLLKNLACDTFLAKSEMEQDYLLRVCGLPPDNVIIAAPGSPQSHSTARRDDHKISIVFFSEPYELSRLRAEEVYREILPLLCRLARENRRKVLLKLHPFENLSARRNLVNSFLSIEDREILSIVDGPLTSELLSTTWFGVTVESTSVLDCLRHNVPCFLCAWLAFSSFEYVPQFARFGVGQLLHAAKEIPEIPQRLIHTSANLPCSSWQTADPEILRQRLGFRTSEAEARLVS